MILLAPPFDTAAGHAWAEALPATVAAAPATAVIYQARNTLVRVPGPTGLDVVVKAFGKGKWWRPGGGPVMARKSFDRSLELVARGIGTPAPVAAIAAAGRGYYVCAWTPDCAGVWDIHDRVLSDDHAADLARFVAHMHRSGALHGDNTPGNILLRPRPDGRFDHQVVDTNRVVFGPVSIAAGLKNLVMLECQDRLVGPYLAARQADSALARRWFALCVIEHRWRWAIKRGTRPWRRKLGM